MPLLSRQCGLLCVSQALPGKLCWYIFQKFFLIFLSFDYLYRSSDLNAADGTWAATEDPWGSYLNVSEFNKDSWSTPFDNLFRQSKRASGALNIGDHGTTWVPVDWSVSCFSSFRTLNCDGQGFLIAIVLLQNWENYNVNGVQVDEQ